MYDGDQLFELLGADEYTYVDDRAADRGTGVTNLAFIKAALRRRVRFWCTLAVVGIVAGLAISVKAHPVYQASTSLLLTPQAAPGEASGTPILNEQAIAESRPVAGLALAKLGLREDVDSFQTTYTVTAPTDRLLVITANAPSSSEAVSRASALATEFLQFRANLVQTAQNLEVKSLQQQISQAKQQVKSISAQSQPGISGAYVNHATSRTQGSADPGKPGDRHADGSSDSQHRERGQHPGHQLRHRA